MPQIECPQCHTAFTVDESGYAAILNQVRDKEFQRELAERERLIEENHEQATEMAVRKAQEELREQLGKQESLLSSTEARFKVQLSEAEWAAAEKQAALERDRDELRVRLEAQQQEARTAQALAVQEALEKERGRSIELERELGLLRQQLDAQKKSFETERQLEVERAERKFADARASIERERDDLRGQVQQVQAEKDQQALAHRAELTEKLAAKDELIADRDREIDRIRDMKARLSTKLLGESLEQHCEVEFNRLRATAFPTAYFEKDNDASEGSKGDYIFREYDEDGHEVVSIMFEMKNEADDSVNRKKNEDHFKKLDRDRSAKGCEYAILVSLLEPESELYNAGIVDVSYRYEKMYVIRPQFFSPLITLIRNAALRSLDYRRQLAEVRQQNVDVTNF